VAQSAKTNPLERVNREVKRRADFISIFPSADVVIRLVDAQILEQTDEWALSYSYMMLETTGSVSHNPVVRLPALTG
jgi:transposase-like protein